MRALSNAHEPSDQFRWPATDQAPNKFFEMAGPSVSLNLHPDSMAPARQILKSNEILLNLMAMTARMVGLVCLIFISTQGVVIDIVNGDREDYGISANNHDSVRRAA